jgi:phosphoinositide-3-kinase regulatory subunit 4
MVYQLLQALVQAHGRGVCHGDIKCENLLLTSWGWLYLADWGPYKPTYLPADNPVRLLGGGGVGGRTSGEREREREFSTGLFLQQSK